MHGRRPGQRPRRRWGTDDDQVNDPGGGGAADEAPDIPRASSRSAEFDGAVLGQLVQRVLGIDEPDRARLGPHHK